MHNNIEIIERDAHGFGSLQGCEGSQDVASFYKLQTMNFPTSLVVGDHLLLLKIPRVWTGD